MVITKTLGYCPPKHDNLLLLGDFSIEVNEMPKQSFCKSYNLSSLVKLLTCYKNPENPTCSDLMLTNSCQSFQNTKL